MSVGFIMLVHDAFHRATQVARHWATAGCPVVIHVDARVKPSAFDAFKQSLTDLPDVLFCDRRACEWGTWSLVEATQMAAVLLLNRFPEVRHAYLASGTCLPLRPVDELRHFLDENPQTDFIESVTTRDVPWTIGGFDGERFAFSFPFAWKSQRMRFDAWVRLQRLVGRRRATPDGLIPHLGSQWWCLTRQTLSAILEDPDRRLFERYFKRVWIPDESYFQTLVRRYSRKVESRSLTLTKFDYQGKPHIFYDDHLLLLRRSDCFVARKIWPRADRLYDTFLKAQPDFENTAEPNPAQIDRVFARAVERRTRGRPGLYMQSRFPNWDWENGRSAAPYTVLSGFDDLFEGFESWLTRNGECLTHGHLYAPDRAEFADRSTVFAGSLPSSAPLRDHNPRAFLTNLLWNTRGERQCFLFGPKDNQDIIDFLTADPNAQISVISGAWAVSLLHANRNFSALREEAARMQKIESRYIDALRSIHAKARVQVWTLAQFLEDPMEHLHALIDTVGSRNERGLTEAPKLKRLDGFGQFLQNLKNQGMQPHLMGDFPVGFDPTTGRVTPKRPYVVR
ncbi:MAG: beta-1,6-N-acetylglucosaminyltransferase [Pseudomonadota bacterium]